MERALLIARVSGLIARPRPPRGALSACVVSTVPASTGTDGVNQSAALGGGEGEGDGRAVGGGWRLVYNFTVPGWPVPVQP